MRTSNKCVFCECEIAPKESFSEDSFEYSAREIGLCDDCFERITGEPKPSNRIKWGTKVGKCPLCMTPIFTINISNNEVTCSTCKTDLVYENKQFNMKAL